MKPLTVNQWAVLFALVQLREKGGWDYPASPNLIAWECGFRNDVRRRGNGAAGKGGWSGYMAPAQRIISSLRGLEQRGLIYHDHRPDGLTGVAYGLNT